MISSNDFNAHAEPWGIVIDDRTPAGLPHGINDRNSTLLAKVRFNGLIAKVMDVSVTHIDSKISHQTESFGIVTIYDAYYATDRRGCEYAIAVQPIEPGEDDHADALFAAVEELFPNRTPVVISVESEEFDWGQIVVLYRLNNDGGEVVCLGEEHFRFDRAPRTKTNRWSAK